MNVSLRHPSSLSAGELEAWRALCAASGPFLSPFQTPGFALAAGKVRRDARVLTVTSHAGKIDLVLPMQLSRSGLARPLGSPMCDVNGPIGEPRALALLPQALASAGVSVYAFSGWAGATDAPGLKLRAQEGCAIADISGGFAAWLESRREAHPKHFKKMRRLARQAVADFGAEEISFGAASVDDLAELVRWKREQFQRTRRHDVLGAAWTRALLEACASAHEPDFAGVMATLRYGGRLAAAEFGLRTGGTLHGWIAAYNPDFAACSPGLVLQERLLERAAEAGVTRAVLGTGESHYKRHYTTGHEPLSEGIAIAAGLAGGPRALASGVLHALEQGGLGSASRLAARTRRRMEVILSVETRVGDKVKGVARALGEDPAMRGAGHALQAAVAVAAF